MPQVQAARVTVVSLNTRGVPVAGSCLPGRYAVIGEAVEAGDADVACFQEVFSWWHLRLLARRMRSFGHASFRPSLAGPAGGLVTFSRLPVAGTVYQRFGVPPRAPGISRAARFRAALKGALVSLPHSAVRLSGPQGTGLVAFDLAMGEGAGNARPAGLGSLQRGRPCCPPWGAVAQEFPSCSWLAHYRHSGALASERTDVGPLSSIRTGSG